MNEPDAATSPGGGEAMQLPDVLDLKAAAALHANLVARRGRDLVLDASEVRRLGGQCLQILLAAVVAWRGDGASLSFANPSAAFTQSLELFGVTSDSRPQVEQFA